MTTLSASRRDPVTGDVAGRPVVLRYGELLAEYAALRSAALLVDRSHRGRTRVFGGKAAEMVTGLVTNDVKALTPGQGQYAAALTAKGKIVADIRIFAEEQSLLVDTSARATAGWTEMLHKYVNPRLALGRDESETLHDVGVFGAHARRIVGDLTGFGLSALAAMPPFGHARVHMPELDGEQALVARVPDLELEGYEIFIPTAAVGALWERAATLGAVPGGLDAWEIARIEAGRPEWGLDIDESTIPQEANLDELHAISYTKGCYVGQETVARVHFRGHVNRHLRGLRFGNGTLPPSRAQLFDHGGKLLGDVRSTAESPRLGGIALGMVRREVGFGTALSARWDGGESASTVVGLPFPL